MDKLLPSKISCELRFPAIVGLEYTAPVELQTALRKTYPYYECLDSGGTYSFESRNRLQKILLSPMTLLFETSDHVEFSADFLGVVDSAAALLDSDYYLRLTLRKKYLIEQKQLGLSIGDNRSEFGLIESVHNQLVGVFRDCRYVLQYGNTNDALEAGNILIDLQFWVRHFEAADLSDTLSRLDSVSDIFLDGIFNVMLAVAKGVGE